VENRGLNFALLEGYHTALMKGRYPVCCLFLEVDPATVDVNIHPSKREVKFHNERMVRQWTAQAIRETLLRFHGGAADQARPGSASSIQSPSAPSQPRPEPGEGPATPLVGGSGRRPAATMAAPAPASRFASADSWSEASAVTRDLPSFDSLTGSGLAGGRKAAPSSSGPVPAESTMPAGTEARLAPLEAASLATHTPPLDPQSLNAARSTGEPTPLLNVPLRLVGVIGRLYVVLESDRGLVSDGSTCRPRTDSL
jgi:DNA mismatch repair protein MutL